MIDPARIGTALSRLLVLGVPSPGISVVEGSSIAPRKWDERGGYGLTGSTLVFTGNGLGKFDVIHTFYEKRDWDAWDAYLKVVSAVPAGRRPRALDVSHPWLVMNKVFKAVILDNSIPKQRPTGEWDIVYNWQQFRAVKFQLAKPEGAAATPLDPVSAQIQANSVKIDALFQKLGGT